jgi:hypothetical protein
MFHAQREIEMSAGLRAMIHQLFGDNSETVQAIKESIGKTAKKITCDGDELKIYFDNKYIKIIDDGQSCCEDRYLHTDDDLEYYVGSKILDYELLEAPDVISEYGDHEVMFLHIKTDKGVFTIETHNEHNGYYGGFVIEARIIDM